MFSLTVLNLDTLSALAWKRPKGDVRPAGEAVALPEAPMAPEPQTAPRRMLRGAHILPGWGL